MTCTWNHQLKLWELLNNFLVKQDFPVKVLSKCCFLCSQYAQISLIPEEQQKQIKSLTDFFPFLLRGLAPASCVLIHRTAPLLPFLSRDLRGHKAKPISSCCLLLPHHRGRCSTLSVYFPFQLHCLASVHWLLARLPLTAAVPTEPALFEHFRHPLTVRPWNTSSVQAPTSTCCLQASSSRKV